MNPSDYVVYTLSLSYKFAIFSTHGSNSKYILKHGPYLQQKSIRISVGVNITRFHYHMIRCRVAPGSIPGFGRYLFALWFWLCVESHVFVRGERGWAEWCFFFEVKERGEVLQKRGMWGGLGWVGGFCFVFGW